jgi:hypothetical protein
VTRFDADTPTDRRELFADAIAAHQERESPFLTIELARAETGDDTSDDETMPWVQFGTPTVNLDCTDAELDTLHALLDDYPELTVEELERPESSEGTNVRITAYADPERLAGFFDRVFREVYDRDEGYRAWVTQV